MNHLTGLDLFGGVEKRGKKRPVILDPVLGDMDDDDAEGQFLQILLVLETAVEGDKRITLALGLVDELDIGKRAPFGLRHGSGLHVEGKLAGRGGLTHSSKRIRTG